jgi:hypothetical protein
MGRNRETINEIQKRVDEIQTEATRLMVFAQSSSDAVQKARLKNIAKVIFKRAMAIESCLTRLKPTNRARKKGPQG